MATEDPTSDVMALPTELLECVLSYLDHTDLHASECTSVAAYDLVRGSGTNTVLHHLPRRHA